jgi:hypothetical protein
MTDSEKVEKFSSIHELSLEALVQRLGPTAGIDRFRMMQFERSRSGVSSRRARHMEDIRALVRENAGVKGKSSGS